MLTITPMTNVSKPSIRKSQNHPGLSSTPSIPRIATARRFEITLAT